MKHSILVAFALTLVACANHSPREAQSPPAIAGAAFAPGPAAPVAVADARAAADAGAAAVEPSAAAASTTAGDGVDVEAVPIEELDNGRICEQRKRPGSNITQTFCYTREERLAQQASRDKERNGQIDELEREARWRDEIIRQSALEGRRPSGFGLGPN